MEMKIDGNLSVHQRTTQFCSDVEIGFNFLFK
ncbi:hypothetical protein T09_13861 [Trichinella sp. T9]|nr:hypothetical protein T09_13861 [Trichinella sp. T9]